MGALGRREPGEVPPGSPLDVRPRSGVEDLMIKIAAPASLNPSGRPLAEFHNWGESHGPLFANTKALRRYVQHLTLPESYDCDPKPTWDGLSMF